MVSIGFYFFCYTPHAIPVLFLPIEISGLSGLHLDPAVGCLSTDNGAPGCNGAFFIPSVRGPLMAWDGK